jgi:hypothetical protein
MYGYNLVGIYTSNAEAQRVKDKLIAAGVSANSIRISGSADTTSRAQTREEPGFFAWLFGDAPEHDRQVYDTHLRQNRVVVSVHVVEQALHLRALEIMEEFHPLGLDDQGDVSAQATGASSTTVGQPLGSADMVGRGTAPRQSGREEQVIPVVKEELAVGKRATEQHTRVRVYTVERPIEEQVTLKDERVIVERRPASGTARPDMPQERTIDVIERHETPVAEKRGRVTEEVVVRKEVTEHPETVRGKVQETRVEVDKEPVGGPPPKPR